MTADATVIDAMMTDAITTDAITTDAIMTNAVMTDAMTTAASHALIVMAGAAPALTVMAGPRVWPKASPRTSLVPTIHAPAAPPPCG